jgi:hypothetical protein
MQDILDNNETQVLEEKKKRRACVAAVKESLASLNAFLKEDLKNSEETASASAEAELGG